MKIMIVVGARPNFMKAAPMIAAIHEHNRKAASSCPATGDGNGKDAGDPGSHGATL